MQQLKTTHSPPKSLSNMSKPLPIILLKTKSTPIDPYHDHFSTHPFGYQNAVQSTPIFVPVLKHQNVNLEYLEELVTRGRNSSSNASEQGKYAGIIITSQRAVEAFGTVLEKLGGALWNPMIMCRH
jgi:uroporphyrinogen-III synthase